ncbi:pyruvate kinase 2 [Plasmodium brasilianum]|uniref:Pyruvate kinase n=2 Tax=Plasmodium (Plasmodium) TaxID=418103 RepID=A0A1D3RJA0_PLAMA|nr:pyruvate kinase 2, putative [Plasmodium malariae]KAI4838006.1 pyruvate kinase 2 [Plasmodium brasilianum]SCN45253.1 pyruvate kinase 2, putative [Plasmodium malariae]
MKTIGFYFFIKLIASFVNGIKYKKEVAFTKWHIQNTEGERLLFLNNVYINKNIDKKKKNILAHSDIQNLKNGQGDSNLLTKKNKISFTKGKQIATIGPATENFEELEKLYLNGIDVFRLNFSHGLKSIKKYIINSIRILEKKYDTSIAILGDIQGPKIRIGEFEKNEKNAMDSNTFVELKEGDSFSFDLLDKLGDQNRVSLNYPDLLKNVKVGQMILLDDGNLNMKVVENSYDEQNKQNSSIKVQVITGGKLYSKKGFCVPNMIMPIEVLNEKDIKDILFCLNEEVDFLGYSFVQTKYDLIFLKSIINDYYESDFYINKKKDRINYDINTLKIKQYDDENDFYIKEVNDYYNNYYLKNYQRYKQIYNIYKNQNLEINHNQNEEKDFANYDNENTTHDSNITQHNENHTSANSKNGEYIENYEEASINANKIFIISKIEKPSAVKNIESIIKLSDGIMIARGDLGIETDLSNLPILQKKIINSCRIKYNKPVIVATQMMESMRFLPTPTRAEVSDIATALYDGCDCVMLSAETATGKYPALTALTQNNVIKGVENDNYYYEYSQKKMDNTNNAKYVQQLNKTLVYDNSYFEKLLHSIRDISNNINLKSIILFSNEFQKIQKLSNMRAKAPIIVITENVYLARKLQLTWGVYPHLFNSKQVSNDDFLSLINYGCKVSKEEGFVNSPDEYSLVTFTKNINKSANLLYLCQPCLNDS